MDAKGQLSSLKRGLAALTMLNTKDRISALALSKKIKVPRTTAHRILDTLVAEGYVIHDLPSHSYRLAGKVRRLSHGFDRDSLTAEIARPILRTFCQQLMTPLGLATPVGGDIMIQVSLDHEAPLALARLPEGTSFPLICSASGHLFLAHCDIALRRNIVAATSLSAKAAECGLPPTDSELDQIRANGYAWRVNPHPDSQEGVLAVPVYSGGAYAASVHLRYMKRLLAPSAAIERYLSSMQRAAGEIEAALDQALGEPEGLFSTVSGPLLLSDSN